MATLKAYSSTKVTLASTQEDLEKLLTKHNIRVSRWTHYAEIGGEPGTVEFQFEWHRAADKPPLAFRVDVDYKGKLGPQGGEQGTTREQAGRALYWHVKNLFDAIDFGIVDLEQAFMPYLLLPSGDTAYERAPDFLSTLASGVPLLSEGRHNSPGVPR